MADFPHRTLTQKLGYKSGYQYALINVPDNYDELVFDLPDDCVHDNQGSNLDLIHFFPENEGELRVALPTLQSRIKRNGMIWVSWPKKSSGIETDLTGDVVRRAGLSLDLVDSKVCSVDTTWSAMRFVIRKSRR